MTRKILFVCLSLCLSFLRTDLATAQTWSDVIPIVHDNYSNGSCNMVVDDSLHIHLFYARGWILPNGGDSPYCQILCYQRLDNWGNPLCAARMLVPDTTDTLMDEPPVLILERNQCIHVIWGRAHSWREHRNDDIYYARFSVHGDTLTPPHIALSNVPSGNRMYPLLAVQDTLGNIWVEVGDAYFSLTSTGEVRIPWTWNTGPVVEPPYPLGTVPAVSPVTNQVWMCGEIEPGGTDPQYIGQLRMDITNDSVQVVWPNSVLDNSVACGDFVIDSTNTFHYLLGMDLCNLFYKRHPTDGQPDDTLVFVWRWIFTSGVTGFTSVADTSFELLYNTTSPQQGICRAGVTLSGHHAFPTVFTPVDSIDFEYVPLIWKRGGYWLVGVQVLNVHPARQNIVMIHVPGPEEPPNPVGEHSHAAIVTSQDLAIFPNPFNSTTRISFSLQRTTRAELRVYDITGRLVTTLADRRFDAGEHDIQFDGEGLASGIYFVSLRAGGMSRVQKLMLLK